MIVRHLAALALVVLGALIFAGCGQGEGQVCQIDGDCAAGLTCQCKLGGSTDARGICHAALMTSCTSSVADTGPVVIDAGSDANTDAGHDAGNDASLDANTDANADVGTDAGSDAGSDAHVAPIDSAMDANADAG